MATLQPAQPAVKHVPPQQEAESRSTARDASQAPIPRLSYAEGYVYRAIWFSKFGGGRFPNAGTFNAGRLLMVVNGYRDTDGRKAISARRLSDTVTSLAGKDYIAFRANRRRRQPRGKGQGFRRATFVECVAGHPQTLPYLKPGRTHRLPRIQKVPLEDTPQESAVGGHEVTKAPLEKNKRERASSNGVASVRVGPKRTPPPALSIPRDRQSQNQERHEGKSTTLTLAQVEASLDKRARDAGAPPTHPKRGRRFEIRDALRRGHTDAELGEAVELAACDPWVMEHAGWGDVVAHAAKHAEKYLAVVEAEREPAVDWKPDRWRCVVCGERGCGGRCVVAREAMAGVR